ncbi:putative quinol monooxygenase [Novosphingobium tardum]|jgi:quinol monooxygenase YgiN|uniref:Quinol monooxygenase n=1 Tax=Novosphingobium tardum TaxID=1538021 RepID=A0ABV8RSX2_9SPHN
MPILIAGTIDFDPARAKAAIEDGKPYIEASRREDGCVAYNWALDPLVPGRVHVYEEWRDEAALAGHFRDESYTSMRDHLGKYGLTGSSVRKYRCDAVATVYDEEGRPRADFQTAAATA